MGFWRDGTRDVFPESSFRGSYPAGERKAAVTYALLLRVSADFIERGLLHVVVIPLDPFISV